MASEATTMGATVSLPEPYSCFPLLSVGDVDSMIHKHRDEGENDFMISTAALSKLLGGSREAEMRAARSDGEGHWPVRGKSTL